MDGESLFVWLDSLQVFDHEREYVWDVSCICFIITANFNHALVLQDGHQAIREVPEALDR